MNREQNTRPKAHYENEWMIVGLSSQNTMLVRGGKNPVSIKVQHSDSEDLFQLLSDANQAIRQRESQNDGH